MLVLLAVVSAPLILSRDRKIGIRGHSRMLFKAMAPVCLLFWLWDVVATARGHWSFNESYILGLTFMGMPVEEWLFFVVVSFVSVFTWESVKYFARVYRKGASRREKERT
jgi:lycopene cyclase domain-containing protein